MATQRSRPRARRAFAGVCALFTLLLGTAAPALAQTAPVKYIVVPQGRTDDDVTLYTIAQQTLGDGDRFPEIFALNKGRRLPDGTTFEQPEQLDAGFALQLPSDASGPGVRLGPLPESSVDTPARTVPASKSAAAIAPSTEIAAPTSAPPSLTPLAAAPNLLPVLAGAALVALLLLVALAGLVLRYSRRAAPARPSAPAPRPPSEPSTSDSLFTPTATLDVAFEDLALQAHFGGFADAGGPPPIVWLRQPHVVPRGGSYVALGSSDPGYLFLDLAQAPGIIALTGPHQAVARVLDALIQQVTALSSVFRPQLVLAGTPTDRHLDVPDAYRFADAADCASPLVPRLPDAPFQLVVCDPLDAPTLARLYAGALLPCVILVAGDQPGAAWTISTRTLEPPPSWQRRPPRSLPTPVP